MTREEEYKAYCRQYREKNLEKIKAYQRAWQQKNKDYINAKARCTYKLKDPEAEADRWEDRMMKKWKAEGRLNRYGYLSVKR